MIKTVLKKSQAEKTIPKMQFPTFSQSERETQQLPLKKEVGAKKEMYPTVEKLPWLANTAKKD